MIGKRHCFVKYKNFGKNKGTSPLQDIVDAKHIRPCPPVSKSTCFNKGDMVEVLHEGSWMLGVISAIISKYRCIVKISKGQEEEVMVLTRTSLRPQYVWREDYWDQFSQDVNGQDVGSISAESREKKNPCIHSDESEAQSTEKIKIDTAEKSCLQEDYHHPSMTSSCKSKFIHGLRPTDLFKDVSEFERNSPTFSIPHDSTSADVHLNDIDTQTQTIKDDQDCHIVHVDNARERQSDKSNVFETPLSNNSAPVVQSQNIMSPISIKKKEELIKSAESKHEVLCLFPQDPHFHPLHKHDEAMREGLAIGSLVAFAGLVVSVMGYTADVSEDEIEGKLKSLDYFKDFGFSIEPVQTYLNNLVMLRKRLNELEGKKKETVEELEEVKLEKKMDSSLLSEIKKTIAAPNENRAYVILKMKKHDSVISNLESVAGRVDDDIASAKLQFNANVCSLVKKKMK